MFTSMVFVKKIRIVKQIYHSLTVDTSFEQTFF